MSRRTRENKGKSRLEQKKAKGSDMTRFYLILGVAAVIGIGGVLYSVTTRALSNAVSAPIDLGELSDEELVQLARGVERGDPDAPVTILEFGDYQCPGCADFATNIKTLLDLNLVQTGKAKFVFYDLPLISIHSNSFLAARSARCAEDQGQFWEYHDELFRNQFTWAAAGDPTGAFERYARELGLDTADFGDCVNSDRHADLVTANMRLATALGLTGTPSVMVSRGEGMATRLAGFDYRTIEDAVNRLTEGG